ncbi:DEAD-domain-containing protein [Daedalea quercina L-15889]|uniref:RNA helicase n=1 Tax=Daedalea quercina L-15889 TaxID=1314783 RepID=A0A165UAU3_9APHY|nr:DEAD-domain-containing protein [Daedalea quercina L-15889]
MGGNGDFVMTIDSDTEDAPLVSSSSKARKSAPTGEDAQLNPDFVFDLTGDPYNELLEDSLDVDDLVKSGSKPKPISVDDIIERRKLKKSQAAKRKRGATPEGSADSDGSANEGGSRGGDDGSEDDEEEFAGVEGSEGEEDPLATSEEDDGSSSEKDEESEEESDNDEEDMSSTGSEEETQAEKERKAAFFAPDSENIATDEHTSFLSMNLSRPIVKSITALGFNKPTPIQAATIPVALLGKDVVGNAVTGSGKTAAFIIPMLERLMYRERGKNAAATRCLVLVPTRELGVQCLEVGRKLAAHTDVRFSLIVGGLSLKAQETELRTRPDVLIATPGRLIDHLRNSPTFTLDALDILVLDEADRMLEDGFTDELTEIIKSCPTSRQTMLFSATMTDSVDELVRMSLNKPVRLFVDPKRSTARGLVQEFVRVRAGKEAERSALLVALCKRSFKTKTIIFLRSKKLAHQMRIVFSILDMKSEELHGDLSQEQRLRALQQFRDGSVDYLMATDLASRGLDIKGIETVINYDMPSQLAQYLHRVGRTARAGKKGRSVTLVGESDRKMLKAAIKHAAAEDAVRHRQVPAEAVSKWAAKLDALKKEIAEILQEEKEEKQLRQAEMELKKGQNMIEHEEEIYSRPARTWFQSEKEKAKAQALSKQQYEAGTSGASKTGKEKKSADDKPKRDKYAGLSRHTKRRKIAMEEDDAGGESGAIRAAVRSAKKASKPAKIGEPERRPAAISKKREKNKERKLRGKAAARIGGAFDKDHGQRRAKEGVRAKKGDVIGGMGKKKGGKRKAK